MIVLIPLIPLSRHATSDSLAPHRQQPNAPDRSPFATTVRAKSIAMASRMFERGTMPYRDAEGSAVVSVGRKAFQTDGAEGGNPAHGGALGLARLELFACRH